MKAKIGLEIHVQIVSLKTKLFCSCSADYRDKPPNTNVCPVCLGLPGTLPVLNEKAVEEAAKIALALSAKINPTSYFFRKNYFYPDLAKNFQITQYDKAGGLPLAVGGYLRLSNGKKVRISRMHLEEDPGRIYYEAGMQEARYSLIDYNRHGVALVEIVTEPDIETPKEAREFLERLASLLEDLGIPVSEYEGAIRCDANISLKGGSRVEVKNITGFSAVEKALMYEITRQNNLLKRGIKVVRETRHWDERRRITISLRKKEVEEEYRYFPEPDLPPLSIGEGLIRKLMSRLEKPAEDAAEEYEKLYGIDRTIGLRIAKEKRLRRLFEGAVRKAPEMARPLAALLANEVVFLMKRREVGELPEDVDGLLEVAKARAEGVDREEIMKMLEGWIEGRAVKYERMEAKIDLEALVEEVFSENPKAVEEALRNPKAINYLMGLAVKKAEKGVDKRELFAKIREALDRRRGAG